MKVKLFVRLLVGLVLAACNEAGVGTEPQELTVFAASSLADAFNELGEAFEDRNEGTEVVFNFAGSSQLAAQLREGVTADVFASASLSQMEAMVEAGRIEAGSERVFVSNRLTIIVPADNPADIHSLEDLAKPGVQLILGVEGVPVRAYTDEIVGLMAADFQERFYGNVVSEEDNVRQVAAKVALGEADAGIVYTSDVTPDIAGQVQQIAIPDAQNVAATYPIAPLADAPHRETAERFIEFILSAEGQAVLSRWGFGPPPGG
jgi:molybdate transport system substrate-binding protein